MALTSARSPYPREGSPLSLKELRKIKSLGPLYDYLKHFAVRERRLLFDDFDRKAIDSTNLWTLANGGGASAVSFAVNVQENGIVRATTGTAGDATASASLIGNKSWFGDRLAMMEIKWTPITAVTETRIETGYCDAVPGSNKSAVNSLTTPTVNTSVVDAALCVYDHTGSTTTNELVTIGGSIAAAKTTFTAPTTRVAATTTTNRISIIVNQVWMWVEGRLMVTHAASGTDYVEGGNAVAPFVYLAASNGTSKSLDLDYIMCAGLRNG